MSSSALQLVTKVQLCIVTIVTAYIVHCTIVTVYNVYCYYSVTVYSYTTVKMATIKFRSEPPSSPPSNCIDFQPTGQAWRMYHTQRLQFQPLPTADEQLSRERCRHMVAPTSLQETKRDGNSFFRALALELTGRQETKTFEAIRNEVCHFISDHDS